MPITIKKRGEALPPLHAVLEALSSRRQRLDELDTQISNLIGQVEAGLSSHFSVRVGITIRGEHGGSWESLAFGKHDGKWQLVVLTGVIGDDDSLRETPLVSSPRETRTRMFLDGHIENLIRGAAVQLDEQITQREKAITAATAIVGALVSDDLPF